MSCCVYSIISWFFFFSLVVLGIKTKACACWANVLPLSHIPSSLKNVLGVEDCQSDSSGSMPALQVSSTPSTAKNILILSQGLTNLLRLALNFCSFLSQPLE
jgi:hypothetical protein